MLKEVIGIVLCQFKNFVHCNRLHAQVPPLFANGFVAGYTWSFADNLNFFVMVGLCPFWVVRPKQGNKVFVQCDRDMTRAGVVRDDQVGQFVKGF